MELTKEQIDRLLSKAYGFVCAFGTLYKCSDIRKRDGHFMLQTINGEFKLELSYNCRYDKESNRVYFKTLGGNVVGDLEDFTVLYIPDSIEELIK